VTIQRTVPNIKSACPQQSREFYVDVLGFEVAMEKDEIVTFASPQHPMVQLSVVRHDAAIGPQPSVSIEVDDVEVVYAKAIAQGLTIVYPLTDEPWGVHRFFVPYAVEDNWAKPLRIVPQELGIADYFRHS
jgi:catechol 2,3-dioxygenase-like lactoylglutathione lyase family enzyme